jgi:hypothetical protein
MMGRCYSKLKEVKTSAASHDEGLQGEAVGRDLEVARDR